MKSKREKLQKRKKSIRKVINGTADRPRVAVFRSNKHISAQIIDDVSCKTLAASSDQNVKKGEKTLKAKEVGLQLAKLAKNNKIEKVVFDRGGYKYHGRVKALAEGLREGGLIF